MSGRAGRSVPHDSETAAASHLGGALRPRATRAFERHLLGCEQCWREVDAGRAGRRLAESARQVAPPELREQLRAVIASQTSGGTVRRPHSPVTLRRDRCGARGPGCVPVPGPGQQLPAASPSPQPARSWSLGTPARPAPAVPRDSRLRSARRWRTSAYCDCPGHRYPARQHRISPRSGCALWERPPESSAAAS